MIRERAYNGMPGLPVLLVLILADLGAIWMLVMNIRSESAPEIVFSAVMIALATFLMAGLFMVNPNEGKVLQLFGEYKGTAKVQGLRWANPFLTKKKVSLRVRNFESSHLKVNDIDGNPIEIAAVVVWKVFETAEAVFEVDDYEHYVKVQSEAAVRGLATAYPYDAHGGADEVALSTHQDEVSKRLLTEVQERLGKAGVLVTETRISHLAYAPEIASAMLKRQQASAIIAARRKIVEGAVGMVENALELLAEKKVVELDQERKASMVSNLLVVLCSERDTQPVVNTGTLYQ
jgi:regulator of protease activity HflC (stomatin/prohibitin superfamily)